MGLGTISVQRMASTIWNTSKEKEVNLKSLLKCIWHKKYFLLIWKVFFFLKYIFCFILMFSYFARVLSYVSVIWSSFDKELLNRVLKSQKHAARVILYADLQASLVALFNELHWIPFYEQCNIDKCSILYKIMFTWVSTKLPGWSTSNSPLAHVTSFLWKWKLHDFASETLLVGHLLA